MSTRKGRRWTAARLLWSGPRVVSPEIAQIATKWKWTSPLRAPTHLPKRPGPASFAHGSMILTNEEMKQLEADAFAGGLAVEELMDRAGSEIVRSICQFFPKPGACLVFAGKGNNGGDALVAAQLLLDLGWQVNVQLATFEQELGFLPRKKFRQLRDHLSPPIKFPCARPFLVIDGLLGIGASGELNAGVKEAACEINRLRHDHGAFVVSVDIPTGLVGEDQLPDPNCVEASFTMTIGFAKDVLFTDQAAQYVGRLVVLTLPQLDAVAEGMTPKAYVTTGTTLSHVLPRRNFDMHKTQCGRIGILAGARGTLGAAVLTASGALNAGGGLVTIYARERIYPLLVGMVPPEVMVKPISSYLDIMEHEIDVLAIGPGLGPEDTEHVLALIEHAPCPAVVDADAVSALAYDLTVLDRCAGLRLLTPHPGEMARLYDSKDLSRRELSEWFTLQHPVTLLFKGSRTIISEKGHRLAYNSTGNPGMATGGMGDVLTGVCAALIGRGLSPYDSARLGAWVCGRAAEKAIFEGFESEETLSATHLFPHLGPAFEEMRNGIY